MLLMIDNYDSFTYNLVQYFQRLDVEVKVVRNNEISVSAIANLKPQYVVISPGPCSPNEAGISLEVVSRLKGQFPILGICLGHQTIAQALGGNVVRAERVMHGKTSKIIHTNQGVFSGLPMPLEVCRYHSLVVEKASLPKELKVTAWSQTAESVENEIMGIQHESMALEGVQFHPEAILTESGLALLNNFITKYR
ncbi:anthranilate synthase component II [Pseudoalteromonas piratica]|uniref:Anthranilate synthase component II n=1 Tax=Pseudoalteromonas piratica TaxID=1348114 RepID=A0A0A7EBF9_9GAMM|nr:aminodeoxychorismate/anthranilate synthase component II [Pseudoalteromonas piratica]AIY63955.1 anthranilate synthase component II [Pseudoalteromonas piratica]